MRLLLLGTLLLAGSALGESDNFNVLMLGNSHTTQNKLPEIVEVLLQQDSGVGAAQVEASRRWSFLQERLHDGVSQELLQSQAWSHVILQAQKYSTSGRYSYPTDAAEEWIRQTRAQGAQPVLFPEWGQRGNAGEAQRVQALHESIANREAACVAPVGLAWDLVLQSNPEIRLHHRDGNHSNKNGAHLAAYVLYEAVSRRPARDLPTIDALRIKPELQEIFRNAASSAFAQAASCDG